MELEEYLKLSECQKNATPCSACPVFTFVGTHPTTFESMPQHPAVLKWQVEHFVDHCKHCNECMCHVCKEWLLQGGDHHHLTCKELKASKEHNQIHKLDKATDEEEEVVNANDMV